MAVAGTQAHKSITSPYTYNDHAFPILRDRCGQCHVDGGPTPMSLMTYADAVPWAESMREQLVAEAMPPWYTDASSPAVKGGHTISAKELDILVTWATGGTPQGDPAKQPAPFSPSHGWKAGPPDLTIPLAAQVMPAGTREETREITVETGLREEKWIKATDLLPGTRSMVREAVVALERGPVLGTWVPGSDPTPAPGGTAFRVPAGARLHVSIRYKKHWQDEQAEKSDSSTIGLYFTDPPLSGRGIETLTFEAVASEPVQAGAGSTSRTLTASARVLAIRPRIDQHYASVNLDAILPNGRRVALLHLHSPRPGWSRRYWLADPVELPKGTRIDISKAPAAADESSDRTGAPVPLQVGLDFVGL